jgi:hypothetical protein
MNKKFIIPVLLIIAVLAGLGYYYGGESLQGRFGGGVTTGTKVTKTISAVAKTSGVGQGILYNFDEYNELGQWTATLTSKQYISEIEVNDGASPLSLSSIKLSIDGTEIDTISQGETTFTVGQEYRAGDHTFVVSGMVEEDYYQNALSGFDDTLNLANVTHGTDSSSVSETELNTSYGTSYYLFIDSPEFTAGTVSSSANLSSETVIYSFDVAIADSDHKPENLVFDIDSSSLNFASGTTDYGTLTLYIDGATNSGRVKNFDPNENIYAFRLMKGNVADGATIELRADLNGVSSGSITTAFNATNFNEKRSYTTDGTTDEDYYYCYSSGFTMCFYPFLDSDYYLNKSYTVSHSGGTATGIKGSSTKVVR